MSVPSLTAAGGKQMAFDERKPMPVVNAVDLTNWICFYHKANFHDANVLVESLQKACKAYGVKVATPEWVEMESVSTRDWTENVESYTKEKKYQIVVFLLDRYLDKLYKGLKFHALCTNGYHSQVVKCESLKKNAMSVCSKLLLQMNYKIGGATYKVDFSKEVQKKNIMIIGVDSSHISGKRTGVAMVASLNKDFTKFYNKIDLIKEENKETLVFCVSSFIREAINKYYEYNKKIGSKVVLPTEIIIYRQGVSREQKEFLKSEVSSIEQFLRGEDDEHFLENNPIPYYYILVNTKTSFKFFEKSKQSQATDYYNPLPGLLVLDDITDPKFFEFYIQPQEVTQGTATPTCYHVAFGNIDDPNYVPKLTFDLCFLYANWQGPVRVPGVLKNAEKLSKMTAKYTKTELHNNLKGSLAYL